MLVKAIVKILREMITQGVVHTLRKLSKPNPSFQLMYLS